MLIKKRRAKIVQRVVVGFGKMELGESMVRCTTLKRFYGNYQIVPRIRIKKYSLLQLDPSPC